LIVGAVLYVFSRLNARFENIVVAILGLLYVVIRRAAFDVLDELAKVTVGIKKDLMLLRSRDEFSWSLKEEAEKAGREKLSNQVIALFDAVALACIGLICLYQLYRVL